MASHNHEWLAKRPASVAGFPDKQSKAVKRRASKACQCCRARKVRCNVIEHGAPCTNCRLDEVPCIVTESKRKRKSMANQQGPLGAESTRNKGKDPLLQAAHHSPKSNSAPSPFPTSLQLAHGSHIPHPLYRNHTDCPLSRSDVYLNHAMSGTLHALHVGQPLLPDRCQPVHSSIGLPGPQQLTLLPKYITPLPAHIDADEAIFLDNKRALTVPPHALRNELLRCYVEFVHPFMPVLDLEPFLQIVQHEDDSQGTTSLFLFQSVMFAGCAYVDLDYLRRAGFSNRREARRKLYTRARLLYDFDYDTDRLTIVQALLMMTSWYERPGDLKDTWHWMGVAASLAHTIGLNRDPARSNMPLNRQRHWKRMWWSCVIRDRLIALGMRRPTRIKAEDCDVPMLTLDDFDIRAIPDKLTCISRKCVVARDTEMQLSIARTCIEKAKLCVCVQHVLSAQYSVPDQSGSMSTEKDAKMTTILLPRKADPDRSEVKACHRELQTWLDGLPQDVQLKSQSKQEMTRESAPLILNRALLHMIYFTTLSALHRPQVLHEAAAPQPPPTSSVDYEILETSSKQVRIAASSITNIVRELLEAQLVQFLPTTGVTVLQPAIITHLLDIKSSSKDTRRSGLQGFCRCIQVMRKLRENYAAADFSLALIEAAVRKADIQIPREKSSSSSQPSQVEVDARSWRKAWSTDDLLDAGLDQRLIDPIPEIYARPLTPPPDAYNIRTQRNNDHPDSGMPLIISAPGIPFSDHDVASKLSTYLASTPPSSDHSASHGEFLETASFTASEEQMATAESNHDFGADHDFDALINFDDLADGLAEDKPNVNPAELANIQGESSGFTFEIDWLNTINDKENGLLAMGPEALNMDETADGRDSDGARFDIEHLAI